MAGEPDGTETLLAALHPVISDDLDGAPVLLKAAVAVVAYLDSDGEEKLCLLRSASPLSVRMGLVEYAREWHRTEVRWLLDDEEDDDDG
ncbi:MAG: hypothetical protein ABIJ75_02510 [Actinomycetota bacterium]